MKKIAFVSDAIWPYNKGGKEKRLFDISTRLSQRGYNVHIYTMKWWRGPNIKIENGVTLHAISKLYPLYSGERRSIKEGILFGLSCLHLLTENWDVIEVDHMPFFPLFSVKLVCLLRHKKMFATWHEVWGREYWKKYLGKLGNIAYIIEKLAVLMPDKIISVSRHTTNKLKKDLLSKKEIITVPDGIDFDHIQKIKPSLVKSDVIFVGRLLSHKNVDVLIKSITILKKDIPSIKCLIIGDGPEKKRLEKTVATLKLTKNVLFLGFLENHDEVYSLIKSSKVFVLPSSREGFGIVVIEANACGIPVITINHKDNAAKDLIIEGENGYTCELDTKEMAKRIVNIFEKGLDKKTKQTCINSAKKYDWNKIVNKIEEEYLK
jgi:glycosyltransferase involved in cell wall biosynthesis